MAISSSPVNQGTGAWTTGTSFTVTITAPTSGNVLVVCLASSSKIALAAVNPLVCTGVTFNAAATIVSNTNQHGEVWFGIVGGGAGTTVTVNLASGPVNYYANVSEWSGINVSGAEKDAGSCAANAASSAALTSAVVTPTNASTNILFIGGGRHSSSLTTPNFSDGTSGATWTSLTQPNSAVLFTYSVAVSTSGTYGFHSSWGGSGAWDCTIAGFKAAAGGGATHGLFLPNPHTGLGAGGQFFSHPIG